MKDIRYKVVRIFPYLQVNGYRKIDGVTYALGFTSRYTKGFKNRVSLYLNILSNALQKEPRDGRV